MKTVLNPEIIKIAEKWGIKMVTGSHPSEHGITVGEFTATACYFPRHRLIFVQDETKYEQNDIDFICLHELGHVIITGLLGEHINEKIHEVKANAIAIGLATVMDIPVSARMLANAVAYAKAPNRRIKKVVRAAVGSGFKFLLDRNRRT